MIFRKFSKIFSKKINKEIDPDEIFIDARNLPEFDQSQFEGRLEKPLSNNTAIVCGLIFLLLMLIFVGKIFVLQVINGEQYSKKSIANTLRQLTIFSERGVIYDRNKVVLASNKFVSLTNAFSKRVYTTISGMAHVLGYIRYPAKDGRGFYYNDQYEGVEGVEKIYNQNLAGQNGLKIVEINALDKIETESLLELPRDGKSLTLSIDSRIQEKLFSLIKIRAKNVGFSGGSAILMDVHTGEIIALNNYPEFDSNIMSDGTDSVAISAFINDKNKPFLNRAINGLYTPGSIVKPFIALAALHEKIIDPEKEILSTGSISIPNPYDKKKKSVFNDWKAHGWVDMRQALAISSDVYFYEIGGGFEDQIGLGIDKIEKYLRMFGFGETVFDNPLLDTSGSIPSPKWKNENFPNDPWRIGDTYNTSIGQYGFQSTPLQAVVAVSAIANNGALLNPTLLQTTELEALKKKKLLPFTKDEITVVKEGMRQAVLNGTAKGLNIPQISIAAKTGTAELGATKKFVNSWIIGFFPYESPRYAFATIMEKGPAVNTVGALYVMKQLFEWMAIYTPEYFKVQS